MTQACISELMIDRLLAGELAGEAAAQIRAHAEGCTSCGGLLRDAEAVLQRFAAAPPPAWLARPRVSAVSVAGGVVAVVALAAAVAIVIAPSWREPAGGRELALRTKGKPSLGVFVSHRGELQPAGSGEVIAPGDRLQLVTSSERAGWLAIYAVDGAGLRTVYASPQPVAAGRDRPLGFSIILDNTRGPMKITLVYCPLPFALDQPRDDCSIDAIALEVQ